ncbi:hypothetical protein [Parahaliea mediterranea]|uniref:hypothetical protein n=1 Tax=Parahaliea mediterranea TaxID=651086 RepID=UPI00147292EC|nr:hypothetical protein [Parahaliea mediterranea]
MMNEVKEANIAAYAEKALKEHRWAATGVSDYPPRDPLVGQSTFFNRYRTFIKTVDHDEDNFAHVFAVEGEWGKGKSRLGHELVAQINDCSKGWYVRDKQGGLVQARLFDDQVKRDEYLSLYIRYSQVASEYQNSDNWFGYGLYKALLPLATKAFDHSIQSEIAKQSLKRLEPLGFDHEQLAAALELDKAHGDEELYYHDTLVTNLVQQAYAYLSQFGIKYVLVVLDELETVAEAATFGLERDEASQLDGQAIRLIGKAIKEEDPRRKLPWLRYVALCSPLLGQQLREIQSTARRFELVELEHNAFADVSDYVTQLRDESRLRFDYPAGLVEAAYAMSGANFGWFNVIMANVDTVLESYHQAGKTNPAVGELFDAVLSASGRVAKHVLDANVIEGIQTADHVLRTLARNLLFGQLPRSLSGADSRLNELLPLRNEYDDSIVSLYRKVEWPELDCRQALVAAKFHRDKEEWFYPSVEQGLNLKALLQNLKTFAVAESGLAADGLLIPLQRSEFKQLVALLYNHPAAEFAADALWSRFIGEEHKLEDDQGTHIGPSVSMLLRLDLRYRSQQHNSMIFRDPDFAAQHEKAMERAGSAWSKNPLERAQSRLIGLFRLLDRQWQYNEPAYPNKAKLAIQMAPRSAGRGSAGGLQFCDGLKLHPKGQAWFAWVNNKDELIRLHLLVSQVRSDGEGRIPVMAFTGSVAVNDWYVSQDDAQAEQLKDDILLYHLNTSEVDVLERIGLQQSYCGGLVLKEEVFTTRFKARLNSIRDFAYQRIHHWRSRLNERGLIAWPLRPTAKISPDDRQLLFRAWKLLAIDQPKLGGLHGLTPQHQLDAEEVSGLFNRLTLSSKVTAQGYGRNEHAGLFRDLDQPADAQAQVPPFLAAIADPKKGEQWTLDKARQHWYWGYLWAANGLSEKTVFDDWMWCCSQLHLLKIQDATVTKPRFIPVPRSELQNAVDEANNWLTGGTEEAYPATVKQLATVYGQGRIAELFSPKGKSPQGTETTEALDALKRAGDTFNALKLQEETLSDVLDERVAALPEILKKRSQILHELGKVYPHPLPPVTLDNTRNINLEDQHTSLYVRVERARLFAEQVQNWAGAIRQRVDFLLGEIHADPHSKAPFPRRLFTLSLQTIANILKGALDGSSTTETQKKEASGSSDTLLHYLRKLKLDKASERMERLAQEVGYDLYSGAVKPPEEINGYIFQTYRQFVQQYQNAVESAADIDTRIRVALNILGTSLPPDYPDPDHPRGLLKLQNQLALVQDSFDGMDEQVDALRGRYIDQTHRGQFAAIKDAPDQLLKSVQQQLGVLGGKLRGDFENVIARYRAQQLEKINSGLRPLINPLLVAMHEAKIESITESDIHGYALHDLAVELDLRNQQWQQRAETLLQGTGISFSRWCDIAQSLIDRKQPAISSQEQQALVDKGILQVQITFGGTI